MKLAARLLQTPAGSIVRDENMEVMVHNVTHGDMFVRVRDPHSSASSPSRFLARPAFSKQAPLSAALLAALDRADAPGGLITAASTQGNEHALGLDLSSSGGAGVPIGSWPDLMLRREQGGSYDSSSAPASSSSSADAALGTGKVDGGIASSSSSFSSSTADVASENVKVDAATLSSAAGPPEATAILFPSMSLLLSTWLKTCVAPDSGGGEGKAADYRNSPSAVPRTRNNRLLLLISGAADPSNPLQTAEGNSTRATALLLQRFVELSTDSGVRVLCIHQDNNGLFRYDDNIAFVNSQLKPVLDTSRRRLAALYGNEWGDHLRVTIALTTGAPARISAVSAGLREYHPDCLHVRWGETEGRLGRQRLTDTVETTGETETHPVPPPKPPPKRSPSDVAIENVPEVLAARRTGRRLRGLLRHRDEPTHSPLAPRPHHSLPRRRDGSASGPRGKGAAVRRPRARHVLAAEE